jgi:ABC-type molybdenum transport system ATPase subunit/photorepair protein PhrA
MKELYLLRGLPGSGKSTLAKSIGGKHFEADMYFMKDGVYAFDASKIKDAHSWCRHSVMNEMREGIARIVVSNTFTQEWEMEAYYLLAEEMGYTVFSLIVENRHGGKNVHGVPEEKLQAMKDRFEIKL